MSRSRRTLGWMLLAVLVVALPPLGKAAAFGSIGIVLIYALMVALGICATAPSQALPSRLGWAVGLSIAFVIVAAATNALIAPTEEGGILLGLIVFSIYLGLPILCFAAVINVLFKREVAR